MRWFTQIIVIFLLTGITGCASTPKPNSAPQANEERFLISIPKDFSLSYKHTEGNMVLEEFVPKGEKVENWTEMITSQTFKGLNGISPKLFARKIKDLGKQVCPGIKSTVGESIIQNGYPTYSWKQVCEFNPNTNRVEATLIKAIAGRENLYVIQKAWAYYPDSEETAIWSDYLKKVMVCDTHVMAKLCQEKN